MEELVFAGIPHHLGHMLNSPKPIEELSQKGIHGEVINDTQVIRKHILMVVKTCILKDNAIVLRITHSSRSHMHGRYIVYITYAICVDHEFTIMFTFFRLIRSTSFWLRWMVDRCAASNHGTVR